MAVTRLFLRATAARIANMRVGGDAWVGVARSVCDRMLLSRTFMPFILELNVRMRVASYARQRQRQHGGRNRLLLRAPFRGGARPTVAWVAQTRDA